MDATGDTGATSDDVAKLAVVDNVPEGLEHDSTSNLSSSTVSTKVPSQQFMRTASRIALHWMREDVSQESHSPGPDSSQLHQDFFVLNACQVFMKLKPPATMDRGWLFLSPEQKQEIVRSIPVTFPQGAQNAAYSFDIYDRYGYGEPTKRKAAEILDIINAKKEMGIIVSDLPDVVGRLIDEPCTLERHMQLLTEGQLIFRVGVVAARYVAMQYCLAWVVQTFKLSRNGREKLEPFNRAKQQKLDQLSADSQPSEPQVPESTNETDTAVEGARRKLRMINIERTHHISKTVDSLGEKYNFLSSSRSLNAFSWLKRFFQDFISKMFLADLCPIFFQRPNWFIGAG